MRHDPARRQIVLATGRFQTIHCGVADYLSRARRLAASSSAEFFVLTGPIDSELYEHGLRMTSVAPRRLLRFVERQVLLSTLLSVPRDAILNNRSSPHHGVPGLCIWARTFLDPLCERLNVESKGLGGLATITLAVVKKAEDFCVYRSGDGARHYSYYLSLAHPGLIITDLNLDFGPSARPELASSTMVQSPQSRAVDMPAIMVAAEIIVSMGRSLDQPESRAVLEFVRQKHGQSTAAFDETLTCVHGVLSGQNPQPRS